MKTCPRCHHTEGMGWCKCTRWQKWRVRLSDNWLLYALLIAGFAVVVSAFVYAPRGEPTYSVPAHMCASHPTGRERQVYAGDVCFAYDKQGICTNSQQQYRTEREREVTCQTFTAWE